MTEAKSVVIARQLLSALGVQCRSPLKLEFSCPVLLVSNHRSVLDALILMVSLGRPVHFVCHPYMTRVPVLSHLVALLGGFALERSQGQTGWFDPAAELLQAGKAVGVFPEGAAGMVQVTSPNHVGRFRRGFAHLAFQVPIPELQVVPVAISSVREQVSPLLPLRLFQQFDPAEPLFDQEHWHPLVLYQEVRLALGRPWLIREPDRCKYRGRQGRALVRELTTYCETEVNHLLSI